MSTACDCLARLHFALEKMRVILSPTRLALPISCAVQRAQIRIAGEGAGQTAPGLFTRVEPVDLGRDRGEMLITQQLACGRGRNSRIAKRSAEDSQVEMQLCSSARMAFDRRVRSERATGCNRRRIDSACDEGRVRSRRRSGRDTRAEGSDEPLDERMRARPEGDRLEFLDVENS